MTRQPRENLPGSAAAHPGSKESTKPGSSRGQRNRRPRQESRQLAAPVEPQMSKYGELLQDVQDETSYFLPVDALAAGTHRYLYHLGDFSLPNTTAMHQFLDDKQEVLARLEQARLSGGDRRSASVLRSYMTSLTNLLDAGYFSDTLWQLRNSRRGLYQLLYMTEIPAYVRGKALVRRLDELATPPTAPAEQIRIRSEAHQQLALQELHLIQQYLLFAEERASRFDDKQAIAERIVKARQYVARLEPRLSHSISVDSATNNPMIGLLVPSLDEGSLAETRDHLDREIEALKRELLEAASHIDPSRSADDVVHDTLEASRTRQLDQETIDTWMTKDFPRLRSFFPGYKLRSVPALGDALETCPPYDDPEAVALRGAALGHRQTVCPVSRSHRWLSPEIALMMTYFPGRAYIQTAVSSWDPCLALHFQREVFVNGLAMFELQNVAGLEGILSPQNSLLTILQVLVEDTAAALDAEILENRLGHQDAPEFFRQRVPLPPDMATTFSAVATFDFGISLARFLFRVRLREMRRISRSSNKKVSWASFYQSIFEQGTFDPALLKNP